MPFYALLAIFLSCLSINIGSQILGILRTPTGDPLHHCFACFWTGLAILLLICTSIAAVYQVSEAVLVCFGLICATQFLSHWTRHVYSAVWSAIGNRGVFFALSILTLACFAASIPSQLSDTGLYHYRLIRWYREFGAVRGLALLDPRFGFSSAIFALTAAFDTYSFTGRTGNLVTLAVFWISTIFAVYELRQRHSFGLFWPSVMLLGVAVFGSEFLFSTAPDMLLIYVIAAGCWLAMKGAQTEKPR